MIPWWLCLVLCLISGCIGALLMALAVAGSDADDRMERGQHATRD